MHLNGEKPLKWDMKGKTCRRWVNELEILDSEKNLDPRGGSECLGALYMYITIIFKDLKQLGQSKSNFIGSICMKGKPM